MASFNPFMDELVDGKHRNIQVVKALSLMDNLGDNLELYFFLRIVDLRALSRISKAICSISPESST